MYGFMIVGKVDYFLYKCSILLMVGRGGMELLCTSS